MSYRPALTQIISPAHAGAVIVRRFVANILGCHVDNPLDGDDRLGGLTVQTMTLPRGRVSREKTDSHQNGL